VGVAAVAGGRRTPRDRDGRGNSGRRPRRARPWVRQQGQTQYMHGSLHTARDSTKTSRALFSSYVPQQKIETKSYGQMDMMVFLNES